MTAPLVVRLPKFRGLIAVVANTAIAGLGVFVAVARGSVLDDVVGVVLLVLAGPIAIGVAWVLVRNEPVLVVTDDGLEVPKLGPVTWSEVRSLEFADKALDVKSLLGEARIPAGRIGISPRELRAEIAARSGGSWFDGKWTSRAS